MSNSLSLDNFASKLANDIRDTIKSDVSRDAEEALIQAINQTVYRHKSSYSPLYSLLDAVEVTDLKIGTKQATFSVIVNASKMGVDYRQPERWNANLDMYGNDFREGLIPTLEEGSSGSPFYNHAGYHFYEKAAADLDKTLIQTMANGLRARGWKVSIM